MRGARGHWILWAGQRELVVAEVASGTPRYAASVSLSAPAGETQVWAENLSRALGKLALRPARGDVIELVAAGLPTLVKVLEGPEASAGDEATALRAAVAQAIPQDLPSVAWDTGPLPPQDGRAPSHLLAATPEEGPAALCVALQRVGWEPTRVLPLPAVLAPLAQSQGNSVFLLHLGARELHLVGAGDGLWQARVVKVGFGLGGQTPEIYLRRLTSEVARTRAAFRRAGLTVDTLLLTGEAGAQADLVERLQTALPEAQWLGEASGELSVGMTDALLAAPRALPLDWTPPVLTQARAQQKHAPLFVAGALLALAGGLVFSGLTTLKVRGWERSEAELRRQIASLTVFEDDLRQTLDSIAEVEMRLERLHDLAHSRDNWHHFLADLQDRLVVVEDVWLDALTVNRREMSLEASLEPVVMHELHLRGRLLDRTNPLARVSPAMRQRLHTLMESFQASPFVQAVTNARFDPSQPGMLGFECTLTVHPENRL